ncbi:stalk domain-containing protein [Paenibacillus hamazuiensis]|uniref:stalk domain-containing protein n=1 Tax=Paenibacillus hamazuiensis TaxID=2936508 RepID=UPI00200F643A|nr:stalk domain-containing protein [Paenibacillus hamazuiensis]
MNRMAKVMFGSVVALMLVTPGWAAAEEMKPSVNYGKADMMMKDGMEFVALRTAAESLGYTVVWNGEDQSVTLTLGKMTGDKIMDGKMADKTMNDKMNEEMGGKMSEGKMVDGAMGDNMQGGKMERSKMMSDMTYSVKIRIGSKTIMAGMKEIMLSSAPMIVDDKTYVPKDLIEMYLASPPATMK